MIYRKGISMPGKKTPIIPFSVAYLPTCHFDDFVIRDIMRGIILMEELNISFEFVCSVFISLDTIYKLLRYDKL